MTFLLQDCIFRETIVAYSLGDCWHEERSDVLVLARNEHARDADDVQLLERKTIRYASNVSVHVLH